MPQVAEASLEVRQVLLSLMGVGSVQCFFDDYETLDNAELPLVSAMAYALYISAAGCSRV